MNFCFITFDEFLLHNVFVGILPEDEIWKISKYYAKMISFTFSLIFLFLIKIQKEFHFWNFMLFLFLFLFYFCFYFFMLFLKFHVCPYLMIQVHAGWGVSLVFYELSVPFEGPHGGPQTAGPLPVVVAGEALHALWGAVEAVGRHCAVIAQLAPLFALVIPVRVIVVPHLKNYHIIKLLIIIIIHKKIIIL